MSVWISAIFGHRWPTLTKATVDQIARASSGEASRTGYKRIYDPRSKCRQIANDDSDAFLLPGDFSVHFGRQIFELGQPVRWGRLLLYKKSASALLCSLPKDSQGRRSCGSAPCPKAHNLPTASMKT